MHFSSSISQSLRRLVLDTDERVYGILTGYDPSFLYLSACCVLRDDCLIETDFAVIKSIYLHTLKERCISISRARKGGKKSSP